MTTTALPSSIRPRRDEPMRTAAEVLLVTAPALDWAARRWVDEDGVDWDRLHDEWQDASCVKSSGEQRLIATVVGLYGIDPWGLDTANNDALAAALRVAVDLVVETADACRSAEAMFRAAGQ